MQELPELDIYRAFLAEQFSGAQITGIEVSNAKAFQASTEQLNKDVIGTIVWFIERRGKHLLFHLDNGKRLMLHLSAGAYLYKGSETDKPSRAAQVTIRFGEQTVYCVALRADDMQLLTVKDVEEQLRRLGPDPFDKRLTLERFVDRFAKKRGSLKTALVDQYVISGIGPVYADEIAYAAKLRPDAKIPVLEPDSWERLYAAMHKVLKEAISFGGAGDQPFAEGDSLTGGYSTHFKVYDREGEACPDCAGKIEKIEVSGRKAFVCPSCQNNQ